MRTVAEALRRGKDVRNSTQAYALGTPYSVSCLKYTFQNESFRRSVGAGGSCPRTTRVIRGPFSLRLRGMNRFGAGCAKPGVGGAAAQRSRSSALAHSRNLVPYQGSTSRASFANDLETVTIMAFEGTSRASNAVMSSGSAGSLTSLPPPAMYSLGQSRYFCMLPTSLVTTSEAPGVSAVLHPASDNLMFSSMSSGGQGGDSRRSRRHPKSRLKTSLRRSRPKLVSSMETDTTAKDSFSSAMAAPRPVARPRRCRSSSKLCGPSCPSVVPMY
mmetsp:Transcript_46011/g.130529  ORF Transcript_46011/g.130529 Transcript_46011/m.130529 type:complete len:272 (-) Transcript_46011:1112-1927(-)